MPFIIEVGLAAKAISMHNCTENIRVLHRASCQDAPPINGQFFALGHMKILRKYPKGLIVL